MVLLPLLLGCAGGMGAPAGAPLPTSSFRAEDRVVLGDFSMVQAIASSYERVYVVYPSAVAEWDPLRRAWQVPRQAPTPDALARVHSAVIDPLDHALWLGGDDGLIHFEPLLDRWERLPIVGRVRALALDATDPARGVWVQAARLCRRLVVA